MTEDAVVTIKDLQFRYRGEKKWALDGISLDIPKGEFLVIMGASEAGKSTLARGIFASLGLAGPFPSPTYLYVVEYPDNIAHIDLYMADDEGFYRLGLEDYFDAVCITVVEWADKLPFGYKIAGELIEVEMVIIDEKTRRALIKSSSDI